MLAIFREFIGSMINIAFFSSTRADSGILRPLIESSLSDSRFRTTVLLSGGHLDQTQGATLSQEFSYVDDSALLLLDFLDPEAGLVGSMPSALAQFLKALASVQTDLVVVLGDRMETLLFTFAATIMNVPIAHIHGGDLTLGALDELHRHAITKLSALHFPANHEAARRLIQMGEAPEAVFAFGSPARDLIARHVPISRKDFFELTGLLKENPFFLITIHPALHDNPSTTEHLIALLEALSGFPDHQILFTAPNLDPRGDEIRETIENYVLENSNRATIVKSLGPSYFDALTQCDIAIGNSSSLVLEAPLLGTRTLLIGRRQEGRTQDYRFFGASRNEIAGEIRHLLSLPKPSKEAHPSSSVSQLILDTIASKYPLSTEKRFHVI